MTETQATPFDVRNRYSGEVQFTAQIVCLPDASDAVKKGLAAKWALKSGAYLSRADLSRADLSRANLSRADLSRADLSGAYLSRANLSGADLSRADLSGADLSERTLRPFRADHWLTLSEIGGPAEARHLLDKLRAGQVDGSTYGDGNKCACLVGTIAAAKGNGGESLDHDSDRPAERWFMMIAPGDTPGAKTGGGFAAKLAVEWTEGWLLAHGHSLNLSGDEAACGVVNPNHFKDQTL